MAQGDDLIGTAGAVGRAAAAALVSCPIVLVALPLLLLTATDLARSSTIVDVVLVIGFCLGGYGILGQCSICICCHLLLHHDQLLLLLCDCVLQSAYCCCGVGLASAEVGHGLSVCLVHVLVLVAVGGGAPHSKSELA